MMDVKTAFLEDGKEYYVINSITVNDTIYNLFSEINDEKNVKIRKIVKANDTQYYSGINDEEELKKVINEFNKKINS